MRTAVAGFAVRARLSGGTSGPRGLQVLSAPAELEIGAVLGLREFDWCIVIVDARALSTACDIQWAGSSRGRHAVVMASIVDDGFFLQSSQDVCRRSSRACNCGRGLLSSDASLGAGRSGDILPRLCSTASSHSFRSLCKRTAIFPISDELSSSSWGVTTARVILSSASLPQAY
jgi:hypothetical protein